MPKTENNYDFRKRLCVPHKKILRNSVPPSCEELELISGDGVYIDKYDEVAECAVLDFLDYIKTSFSVKLVLTETEKRAKLRLKISPSELSGDAVGYKGRRITVSQSGIEIIGYDSRGLAAGLYYLEEKMTSRRAPYLAFCEENMRPAFAPRMVHSGYGMDLYPDEYLSTLAHSGYDAILAFVKDNNHSAHGECDFADIVKRAKKYGIDFYAYSYLENFMHPEDEGAKEHYAELYGGLFRDVPGLRGIVFVGESIEFSSNDPHVAKRHYYEVPEDGIPDGKLSPGWYPCYDYPEWISLVRDSIREVSAEADVVFWSYNFGFVNKEARLELLRRIPTDISLLVTYEMFDTYKIGNGTGMVMDYTLSNIGPSEYFISEAEVAKERGIRLYAMTNTGGRTWDFGTAPYEPFPDAWHKRCESVLDSQKKYGLSGLMESHHFGFLPSFVSRLITNDLTVGSRSYEEKFESIAKELCGKEYEKFISAISSVSKSIDHYIPSDENQYGPFRIGPSFPLCLSRQMKVPADKNAHFGNRIYFTIGRNHDDAGFHDPYSVRIKGEIAAAELSRNFICEGLGVLRSIKNKSEELLRIINLISFIEKCYTTAINAKKFYILRYKLLSAETIEAVKKIVPKLEAIGRAEIKNAEKTIPLVEYDSSIGYEPSMGYQCDKKALLWKIKQVNYMIDTELALYKRSYDQSFKNNYYKFPPDIRE